MIERLFRRLAPLDPSGALPDPGESVFFDQECVKCGATFDVPPDFAFDRRRAYYCPDCTEP